MTTTAIIQAREGSTRFPNKILQKICGRTVLEWMIQRVRQSQLVDDIVIATTPTSYNIHKLCAINNIKFYVGSENDVLQRVYYCALSYNTDIVVDLTSDCPLVDPKHIDQLIDKLYFSNNEYISNVNPRLFFDGADIQVYTIAVLKKLNEIVKEPNFRQHTGFNAIISKQFDTTHHIKPSGARYRMPEVRLTLDYPEDLEPIKQVIKYFVIDKKMPCYSYNDICNLIIANPEILTNSHLKSKEPGE